MAMMNVLQAGQSILRGVARGPKWITPDYASAMQAGFGDVLTTGLSRVGIASGLGFMSQFFFKRIRKAPPGAPVVSGKRGIDGNNMNAAGLSLAMHRNRRSH